MKKKKSVLIFDLDRTLFDTDAFMRDNHAILGKYGISRQRALAVARERFIGRPFHPAEYMSALFDHPHTRKKARMDFLGLLARPEGYWYDGAPVLLKKLKKDFTLVLLSYGTPNFQRAKIGHYAPLFDRVHITNQKDKKKDLKKIKEFFAGGTHFFFDDKPLALRSARQLGMRAFQVRKSAKDKSYFDMLHKKIKVWLEK